MKIISWNVNGIRAIVKKGFEDFLKTEKPDVLCLQEIKISSIARNKEKFDFAGYQEFWNSAQRPGYSGTMILVKDELVENGVKKIELSNNSSNHPQPLPAKAGQEGSFRNDLFIGEIKFPDDSEGRVQILEFGKFYLANVYFPNANHELSRLDFKLKFNDRLLKFLKKLENKKPIILCGDYNVAHQPIDLANPKENEGNAGYTKEERAWMDKFLQAGFVDTFRYFNPKKIQYSWWSYRFGARVRNIGWRIDYFCVSCQYIENIRNSFILDKILGSDHCPVGVIIQ